MVRSPHEADIVPTVTGGLPRRVRVGVWEENEIVRRGLMASLAEDRTLHVASAAVRDPAGPDIDVAVVSGQAARSQHFSCPVVVCSDQSGASSIVADGNKVVGVLDRDRLTGAQLRATVHAAAAGLLVSGHESDGSQPHLDRRSREVLELLADGFSTREIAERMNYSERTIKKLITALQTQFEARSRAQVVAQGIRRGLI